MTGARKIVQLSATADDLFALCSDGTLWRMRFKNVMICDSCKWTQVETP